MASEIFSFVFGPVGNFLFGKLKSQVQYVTEHQEYLSKFQKEINQLLEKREDAAKLVNKAKREMKEPSKQVSEWLKQVQSVECEWVTLNEGMNTSNRCFKGLCPNLSSRRKISKQILKLNPKAEDLDKSGNFTVIAHDPPPPDVVPQGASDMFKNISSREWIMKDVMEALQDDNIRSIGVYGMGGIGKTTLAKNINNELLVKHYFRKVIMVTVSKDPDMKLIQGRIAERLKLELKENDIATRANSLYERLKQETSVLILLDDIWDTIEVGELGFLPDTEDMDGKLILTTRNANICKRMKVHKTVEMRVLPEDESWILFKGKAGSGVGLTKFQHVAREIVRRCKGSPLAIATLGSTLCMEENESVWNHALSVLQNPSAMELEGIMPEVVTSLALSYECLPNPNVQLCFLYCCLFPKDYSISLKDLRNYGIGEKFLTMTDTLQKASDQLFFHVKILKDCGLLLDGDEEESVKMHDIVREVAIFIADRDHHGLLVSVDEDSRNLSHSEKLNSCKRISLTYSKAKVLSDTLEFPELHSLLIGGTEGLTMENDNFFQGIPTLSVVDVRAKCTSRWGPNPEMRIPESVSQLKNVQILYLHSCDISNKVSILEA